MSSRLCGQCIWVHVLTQKNIHVYMIKNKIFEKPLYFCGELCFSICATEVNCILFSLECEYCRTVLSCMGLWHQFTALTIQALGISDVICPKGQFVITKRTGLLQSLKRMHHYYYLARVQDIINSVNVSPR